MNSKSKSCKQQVIDVRDSANLVNFYAETPIIFMIAKFEAAPQIIHCPPAMSSVSPRSVLSIKFYGPKARWSDIDIL